MIIRLNNEGKTVVLVTHDNSLAQIAKRVIKMADGKVLSDELTKWGEADKEVYGKWETWKTDVSKGKCVKDGNGYTQLREEK